MRAACVRLSGSWAFPGPGLQVGMQHLGQEKRGLLCFLSSLLSASLLAPKGSALVDFSSRSLCSCWQHPRDSAPLPLAPRCPCKWLCASLPPPLFLHRSMLLSTIIVTVATVGCIPNAKHHADSWAYILLFHLYSHLEGRYVSSVFYRWDAKNLERG